MIDKKIIHVDGLPQEHGWTMDLVLQILGQWDVPVSGGTTPVD